MSCDDLLLRRSDAYHYRLCPIFKTCNQFKPRNPKSYNPAIGVIGCGGIAAQHLNAYRHAGFRVTALCDHTESKARAYQDKFYPEAFVTTDYRELLARDEIEVVDITTHPEDRVELIEAALRAGKHVLSQKPFVVDLKVGERLVELADACGVNLAVNQNGRWAPHFSYIRQAIKTGLLGQLMSVYFSVHWDHNWIIGTRFEEVDDLVLYDFGIHWFDLASHFFEDREALRVAAFVTRAAGQRAKPPMLAQAIIEFEEGQASLAFNASVEHGQEDRTVVAGSNGTIISIGPSLSEQTVTLYTADGYARPALEGTWFREGFHGAMAELLCAIEEGREPVNNARDNLRGLNLCFAAIASANEGGVVCLNRTGAGRDGGQTINYQLSTMNYQLVFYSQNHFEKPVDSSQLIVDSDARHPSVVINGIR